MTRIAWRCVLVGLLAATQGMLGCDRRSTSGAGSNQELTEIRITRQYGLAYLPLTVVQQRHLLEKAAKDAGLGDVKVSWLQMGSGASSTDALLSGSVDYVSMGPPPFILLWGKTQGDVKAVASLGSAPTFLNTTNPRVKSLRDFSASDRIALPAVKVSMQAVVLEMAAAKELGDSHFADLDRFTVSMKPPDANAALLSGGSEITAHFSGEPFAYREQADPRVHTVLTSFDVLGGSHTGVVLVTTRDFHDKHPKASKAMLAALEEAQALIQSDKRAAAQDMINAGDTNEPIEAVVARVNDPNFDYSTAPSDLSRFSDFMFKTGILKNKPAGWKDLFFSDSFEKKGG